MAKRLSILRWHRAFPCRRARRGVGGLPPGLARAADALGGVARSGRAVGLSSSTPRLAVPSCYSAVVQVQSAPARSPHANGECDLPTARRTADTRVGCEVTSFGSFAATGPLSRRAPPRDHCARARCAGCGWRAARVRQMLRGCMVTSRSGAWRAPPSKTQPGGVGICEGPEACRLGERATPSDKALVSSFGVLPGPRYNAVGTARWCRIGHLHVPYR